MAEEQKTGGDSKKILLLFIAMPVFMLLGLVAGLYMPSMSEAPKAEQVENVSESDASSVEGEAQAEAVLLTAEPLTVTVGPFVTNISDPDNYQYVQLSVVVVTRNPELGAFLEANDRKLKFIAQGEVRKLKETEYLTNEGISKLHDGIRQQLSQYLEMNHFDLKYVDDLFISDIIVE